MVLRYSLRSNNSVMLILALLFSFYCYTACCVSIPPSPLNFYIFCSVGTGTEMALIGIIGRETT